jgi:hypothetical protein
MQQGMGIKLKGVSLRYMKHVLVTGGMDMLLLLGKASTKGFTGLQKGRYLDVDTAVNHFIKEIRVKALTTTEPRNRNYEITWNSKVRFMWWAGLSLRHQTSICQKI